MNHAQAYLILVTTLIILVVTALVAAVLLEYATAFYALSTFWGLSLFTGILAALDDDDRITTPFGG